MRHAPLVTLCVFLLCATSVAAQEPEKKAGPRKASIYTSLPSGYTRVGNTMLFKKASDVGIDVIGQFGTRYYSSTYSDRGYRVAMKVGSNAAVSVSCNSTTTSNGVTASTDIVQQGTMARLVYTFRNTTSAAVTISAGVHADVMIGNNDRAPLSRRLTPSGTVYGMTMKNGDGSQLCALFGGDMTGVSAVDAYWFGYYGLNSTAEAMVGNYKSGDNWMQENGSYDSGMGWCWKNRTIAAGQTLTLSWLICVGEVNIEPKATYTLSPVQSDAWNYCELPHPFHVEGNYESPAGLDGYIEFSTDGSEEWQQAGTGAISSGSNYSYTFNATFDPEQTTHSLRLRTRDAVGNTTMLDERTWADPSAYTITGIEDKVFNGQPQTQAHLQSPGIQTSLWTTANYNNNVHAGEATFDVVGVYPTTMGRRTYTFNIDPAPLPTSITLSPSSFTYDGTDHRPSVRFTGSMSLVENRDYVLSWSNNVEPGTAYVTITGQNDFTGERTLTFAITKIPVTSSLYDVTVPAGDIEYDGEPHGATVTVVDGLGTPRLTYHNRATGQTLYDAPVEAGDYDVYLQIDESQYYAALSRIYVGTITILAGILPGDANADGAINVLDAQWTLRYILAPAETTPFNFENANTFSSDQLINVQDIVCTVNIILGQRLAAAPRRIAGSVTDGVSAVVSGSVSGSVSDGSPVGIPSATLIATPAAITLAATSASPVAAIDLLLAGIAPDQLSLALPASDFQLVTRATDEGTRAIIISPTGRNIVEAAAEAPILLTSTAATPVAALAATPDAREVKVGFDATDGIAELRNTSPSGSNGQTVNCPIVQSYSLSGQRLTAPRRGINVVGGRKVVVR